MLRRAAIRRRPPRGLTALRTEPAAHSFIGREREIADIIGLVDAPSPAKRKTNLPLQFTSFIGA
jgi:hypothetical protein